MAGVPQANYPWGDCEKCRAHYNVSPGLEHTFSSVGIDYGISSWNMALNYFNVYHEKNHRT